MAEEKNAPVEEPRKYPCCIMAELENVAVNGRSNLYSILTSLLEDREVIVTPALFSRYALTPQPKQFVGAFLKAAAPGVKIPEAQTTKELLNGLALNARSGQIVARPGFQKFCDAAIARGAGIALISAWPREVAEAIIEKMGWNTPPFQLHMADEDDRHFPRSDNWLHMARSMGSPMRRSLALVSTQISLKAAISAGFRCVAVPDEFTAYQDFGGAEVAVESLEELDAAAILDRVIKVQA